MGAKDLAVSPRARCDGNRPVDRALHSVSVRWIPPVLSQVSLVTLGRGALTALGARARRREVISVLAQRFTASQVVLTDSGTSALALALRVAGASGAPIALPAYS